MSSWIVPTLTSGGAATVITSGIGGLVVRTLKRVASEVVNDALKGLAKENDLKAVASDVTDLKVKFASETGGNSNGIRQVVNELDRKVDGVIVDVAFLKGQANKVATG
jgi:6-phosphofructokinase